MLYKDDWEQAKERFLAWWEGEVVDRVALQVQAPRKGVKPQHRTAPPSLGARWTDIEWRLWQAEESFRTTFFGGEAFPCFWCNLGPDILAACLGAELVATMNCVSKSGAAKLFGGDADGTNQSGQGEVGNC